VPLAGDIIVAASDARFCQLEPKRGLAPLGGATIRYVQRAGWGNAMYHLLTADEFTAAEAYRIGLVQEVVDPGQQVARALAIGAEIATCAPLALVHTIANARLALEDGEPAAIAAIPAMAAAVQATEDFKEGIASFVERRPAQFKGR
jgi:enoyl-CoA hydratase